MTKAILLLWIGMLQSQTTAVDHFNTMAECHAAAAALLKHDSRLEAVCLPYETEK